MPEKTDASLSIIKQESRHSSKRTWNSAPPSGQIKALMDLESMSSIFSLRFY